MFLFDLTVGKKCMLPPGGNVDYHGCLASNKVLLKYMFNDINLK